MRFSLDLGPLCGHLFSMTILPPIPFPGPFPGTAEVVAFHRTELSLILTAYGRQVAAGEWRDYGIAHQPDCAVFAIYRRTAESRSSGSRSTRNCGRSRASIWSAAPRARCCAGATTWPRSCACWNPGACG